MHMEEHGKKSMFLMSWENLSIFMEEIIMIGGMKKTDRLYNF